MIYDNRINGKVCSCLSSFLNFFYEMALHAFFYKQPRDRRIAPWKIAPRRIVPQQIAPGKIAPRIIAPR